MRFDRFGQIGFFSRGAAAARVGFTEWRGKETADVRKGLGAAVATSRRPGGGSR
jgi:hypothetical protein